jgi:aminoglycoside 6'-N-acetyltransferase
VLDPRDITFRRLARADFPLLSRWLATPHVMRWWNHDPSIAAIEHDFGAAIDGDDPADIYIALLDGRPAGLIQRYRFIDNPGYMDELAPMLADYFVGEPHLLRRGVGLAMIRALVVSTWVDYPQAPSIVVPVSAANLASWRVLERAGFTRVAEGPLAPDNPVDGDAHFVYQVLRPRPAGAP